MSDFCLIMLSIIQCMLSFLIHALFYDFTLNTVNIVLLDTFTKFLSVKNVESNAG